MSETIDPVATEVDQQEFAQQLLAQAKEQGVELVGPDGLLNQLTKNVLETALEAEMDRAPGLRQARPGRARQRELPQRHPHQDGAHRDRPGRDRGAAGHRTAPSIRRSCKKRQRRLTGVDEIVLSLTREGADDRGDRGALRRGLRRHGLQGHHLQDHRQGDRGDDRVAEPARWTRSTRWCSSTRSTSRSATGRSPTGRSTSPSGSPCDGERDILGLWAGDGGEGAKFWLSVLTEIKNRGVADVCIVVCDGLKGLPEAINTVWAAPSCRPA